MTPTTGANRVEDACDGLWFSPRVELEGSDPAAIAVLLCELVKRFVAVTPVRLAFPWFGMRKGPGTRH